MAELLGAAASGMSVVSLAIQVAESIKKLKDFHDLMKAAPEEIRLAIDEIETLSFILADVDRDMQQQVSLDPRTKSIVLRSYRLCRNGNEALRSLVVELEEQLGKGKKRGSFKVAMKQDKIESFRKKLDSAKATMLLANQVYDRAVQGQNWESHERDMLEIRSAFAKISSMKMLSSSSDSAPDDPGHYQSSENRKPENHISEIEEKNDLEKTEPALQGWTTRTRRKRITKQQYSRLFGIADMVSYDGGGATSTSISFALPRWIYARAFQIHLTKCHQGWDHSFRAYRTLPYRSQVLLYSMNGDVEGIRQLFASGQASPFVVDPEGRTPLHVISVP